MGYVRYNGNVEPFGSSSTGLNRTIFGATTQSDDINLNLNTNFKLGWEIVNVNSVPTKQDFNAQGFTLGYLISYLYQNGIAEYKPGQIYQINSLCLSDDGLLYQSKTADNTGNALSNKTHWRSFAVANLDASLSFDVGVGGDFTTINEALEFLSGSYIKVFKDATIDVTVNLLTGFVMEEQVLIDSVDLSWITITGDDAETSIDNTTLVTEFSNAIYGFISYPAFGARNNASIPNIDQLFSMDGGLSTSNKTGCTIVGNSKGLIKTSGGFKNGASYNIVVRDSSFLNARDGVFTGAGEDNMLVTNSSNVNINGADLSSANGTGIVCNGSYVNATGATISSCNNGVQSGNLGILNLNDSIINDSTVNAILSRSGSRVSIVNGFIQNQTTGTALNVLEGSEISANGIDTTGTTATVFSQTVNTLASTGIIYN